MRAGLRRPSEMRGRKDTQGRWTALHSVPPPRNRIEGGLMSRPFVAVALAVSVVSTVGRSSYGQDVDMNSPRAKCADFKPVTTEPSSAADYTHNGLYGGTIVYSSLGEVDTFNPITGNSTT